MFKAVQADIEAGWETFDSIKDHRTYPVSIVINKDAFQALFPSHTSYPFFCFFVLFLFFFSSWVIYFLFLLSHRVTLATPPSFSEAGERDFFP